MAELNLGIEIKASAEDIYTALITPESLTTWFAEHVDISLEDNRYDFWGKFTPENPSRDEGRHRLVRLIPNRLLEFEWELRGAASRVQYEIHPNANGCVLTMYHRNLPVSMPNQSRGHTRAVLEISGRTPLRDYVTGSKKDGHTTCSISLRSAREMSA